MPVPPAATGAAAIGALDGADGAADDPTVAPHDGQKAAPSPTDDPHFAQNGM
jgi:hypothetical protein